MKVLYVVGKIVVYTGLVITAVFAAILMAAARAGKVG